MNPKDLVGAKKAPLGVVPMALLVGVAPAMHVGAQKYGPFNWREQPVQVMTYLEAILRHITAFIDRQDVAEDTGISHLAHAGASIGILMDAFASDNVIDNRPIEGPVPAMLRAQDNSAPPKVGGDEPVTYTFGVVEAWGTGDGPVYGSSPVEVTAEHRGEYDLDVRINGLLACCGQTDHALDCPQWR